MAPRTPAAIAAAVARPVASQARRRIERRAHPRAAGVAPTSRAGGSRSRPGEAGAPRGWAYHRDREPVPSRDHVQPELQHRLDRSARETPCLVEPQCRNVGRLRGDVRRRRAGRCERSVEQRAAEASPPEPASTKTRRTCAFAAGITPTSPLPFPSGDDALVQAPTRPDPVHLANALAGNPRVVREAAPRGQRDGGALHAVGRPWSRCGRVRQERSRAHRRRVRRGCRRGARRDGRLP